MKLDTKAMRYLTADDWRVLTSVEMGSKNHEVVPTPLIERISRVRGGASGVHKSISALAKAGLIGRVKDARYDGYRLTYGGLDYLALHTYSSRGCIYSVGHRIGVGKESDITAVADETGTQLVLKIHRLGRISFRTVKANRDYLKSRTGGSWMYLSRLSATKEYAFMNALAEEGFPVPRPISQSRHTVLMEYVHGTPLRQVASVPDPAGLYADLISLILRLATHGLIHGDFNEFNIILKEEKRSAEGPGQEEGAPRGLGQQEGATKGHEKETPKRRENEAPRGPAREEEVSVVPVVIDFPQMVSMLHPNAEMYFDRDVSCLKRFFERRFHFFSTEPGPFFGDAWKAMERAGVRRLDAVAEASGFTKKMNKDLEAAIRKQYGTRAPGDGLDEGESGKEGEGEGESGEEEEEDKDESGHDDGIIKDQGDETSVFPGKG